MRRRDVIRGSIVCLGYLCAGCRRRQEQDPIKVPVAQPPPPPVPPPPPPVWASAVFPTEQQGLLEPAREDVFQPTAAGTRTSALYGSVRTSNRGGRLRASFHEGIDIAAIQRDSQGRPCDDILAVAEGRVAYVNKVAGNSTYGTYVVVEHDEPMGKILSLYAHLAAVTVQHGDKVMPGSVLGRMGNTATYNIPMSRAHLHFEIGVMLNTRFLAWYKGQKLTPSHDLFHGWNILGVDPLDFFARQQADTALRFDEVLDNTPVGFELVIKAASLPDYFKRYPSRWRGAAYSGGHLTAGFSESGVPLWARAAEEAEISLLNKGQAEVVTVNKEVLGRNGTRLVLQSGSRWHLGTSGARRVELLLC
ncbi:MAG: M23 family metallopeptidase [Kiritimatiellae bacterium]|nr:M23 family metallopeptidase [Kiritimatiellia bacterium]